jgi:CheY-like chemotaxis protein
MREFRILQVEDDAQAVVLRQQAFQRAGIRHPVEVMTDGQRAIDYLAGKASSPDGKPMPVPHLVLLKMKLPHLPGMEVLQWIRSQPNLRSVVVIALSCWEHHSDLERAYELGANSCVVLPSEPEGWLEFARSLRAWWLVQNQFFAAQRATPATLPSSQVHA